ncbi:hypothetical protein BC835DRAFT_445240 [Cytidiella melzeri]|nr:hypothetical protein BC835DRAFT_445240 [Cytidiella melzeri]
MGWLQVFRLVTLYSTTTFSLTSVVLSAHLIALVLPSVCAAMSLGAAMITLVTLPLIIFLDAFRKGVHTSPIIVEIFWFSLMGVLWLVAAGMAAMFISAHSTFCMAYPTICTEVHVVEGLSIACSAIFLAYACTLLLKSVIVCCTGSEKEKSVSVWTSTVRDAFATTVPETFVRASYNPWVLDVFAVKEDDDPFQRTPSFRESVADSMFREHHIVLAPDTPRSSTLLHNPAVTSPLVRPPTPLYPGVMHTT